MRTISATGCAMLILLGASVTMGAESHEARVAKTKTDFLARRDAMLNSLAELDVSLQAHGIASPEIATVRTALKNMPQLIAWRDQSSRETKTREAANETLQRYLQSANAQLTVPRQQLERIKKAEYEAWAAANPGEARIDELRKRVVDAEDGALNAQRHAQNAEETAEKAAQDASWAMQEARNEAARAARAESDRNFYRNAGR